LSYIRDHNFKEVIKLINQYNFEEAKEVLKKDYNSYSQDVVFLNIYGIVLNNLNENNFAESIFSKALKLKPNDIDVHVNLAVLYSKKKELQKSKDIFLKIIKIFDNKNIISLFNLGLIFLEEKNYLKAENFFKQAINVDANFYEAYHQLGLLYEEKKEFNEAIYYYQIANKKNKRKFNTTLSNLANVYWALKDFNKAISTYKEALDYNGDKSKIYKNLTRISENTGNIQDILLYLEKGITEKKDNFDLKRAHNFYNLYKSSNPGDIKILAENYRVQLNSQSINFNKTNKTRLKKKKPKIGFVSADFMRHPVGYFLFDLIDYLKRQFEILAFSNNYLNDDYTNFFKKKFDKFFDVTNLSDFDLAKLIYDIDIDILLDLGGYSGGSRLNIFAYKPAPIQISWAGYLSTTGFKEIDYIIGDPYVTPKNQSNIYTEKILQLPEIWCHLSTSDIVDVQKTQCLPATKNKFITFGSFNNPLKLNERLLMSWGKILRSIPSSRLLIKGNNLDNELYKKKIEDFLVNQGVKHDQLIIEDRDKRNELLNKYNQVDLVLDTFPYSGGTTNFEATWMGVPILTMYGENFLSRCGYSINNNLNLLELNCIDFDEYENKAIKFSKELEKIFFMKKKILSKILETSLFNSEKFATQFCKTLKNIYERYFN